MEAPGHQFFQLIAIVRQTSQTGCHRQAAAQILSDLIHSRLPRSPARQPTSIVECAYRVGPIIIKGVPIAIDASATAQAFHKDTLFGIETD